MVIVFNYDAFIMEYSNVLAEKATRVFQVTTVAKITQEAQIHLRMAYQLRTRTQLQDFCIDVNNSSTASHILTGTVGMPCTTQKLALSCTTNHLPAARDMRKVTNTIRRTR